MSEPHTLASFEALPDDAARDEAMARALGWRQTRCAAGDIWERGTGGGSKWSPPPIFTGGDGDPFANWHLLAEVLRALPVPTVEILSPGGGGRDKDQWAVYAWDPEAPYLKNEVYSGQASTPHRAACLAAVAAGLVPREES